MLQLIVEVIQSLPILIHTDTDTLLCPLSAHTVQIHMLYISYKCYKKIFKTVFTSNGVIIKSADLVKAEAKAEKKSRGKRTHNIGH